MTRLATMLALGLVGVGPLGCNANDLADIGAGVGSNRTGCANPGTHSLALADHSCACEAGYAWCSDALTDFDCCVIDDPDTGTDTGEATPPDLPCDAELLEQLVCIAGPTAATDPSDSAIWACNGERWVEVPSYATHACQTDGHPFAYGCRPREPIPQFLCGYGQGSSCEIDGYASVCLDEDIIDTCTWSRRTVDRCSRLCSELEVFGPGFATGSCSQPDPGLPATCICAA